jgi:hypothetical protein
MPESKEDLSPTSYRLTLQGDGISIDREIDAEKALAVVELVMSGAPTKPTVLPKPAKDDRLEPNERKWPATRRSGKRDGRFHLPGS